jgi:hypothetical protein
MYCICGESERKREHGPMRMEESEKRKGKRTRAQAVQKAQQQRERGGSEGGRRRMNRRGEMKHVKHSRSKDRAWIGGASHS